MGTAALEAHQARRDATGVATDPVAILESCLSVDDTALDYGNAKLTFDQLVDPAPSTALLTDRLDRLARGVRDLAPPPAGPDATIATLRRFLYVAGPWNDGRPFGYDHADPLGRRIGGKLLSHYLETRRGNCVSMPALFLILADRLGLDVAFVTAPLHIFLRYRSESGQIVNIEASSGGHPARDAWYRQQMPISDRAVESGLYLRTLAKREGVALMATTVLEHLIAECRFEEALTVSGAILRHAPRDAYTLAKRGSVCAALIDREFTAAYRSPAPIPPPRRARHRWLTEEHHVSFAAARALGWEPVA